MENLDANCADCIIESAQASEAGATRGRYSDLLTAAIVMMMIALFVIFPTSRDIFGEINRSHGMVMGFAKFAILGTFGEMLSLRMIEGVYLKPGWGLLPKAFVWGLLSRVNISNSELMLSSSRFRRNTPAPPLP